ncbi:uncharacterized protein LOC134247045, partial [Saccostrea cucullata]|uniref:uncharacterized protein LOC134247045 n=1 Tax=Saccostrea cuccullata TaxID=36930 RepID=UPI002ED2817A
MEFQGGRHSYTVKILVTNQYEHVDIALKAIKTSFDISSTVSPVTVSVPENTNNLTSILSITAEARLEGTQYLLWNQSDDMVEWDFAGTQKKISLTLKKRLEYKEDKHLFPITVRTW